MKSAVILGIGGWYRNPLLRAGVLNDLPFGFALLLCFDVDPGERGIDVAGQFTGQFQGRWRLSENKKAQEKHG
jgi:hypothetical protein